MKACDGGTVQIDLKDGNGAFSTPFIEFLGVVTSPQSLREESRVDFGSNLGKMLPHLPDQTHLLMQRNRTGYQEMI